METPKRILVVDDEQDLCEILRFNLTLQGYEVETALSGSEALKKEPRHFHLLLLDVMMPEMSGFELAKRLKSDTETSHIPIIFLTAKDTEDDVVRGFALGADDYVAKPFSIRELMARVKAVLNRSTPEVDTTAYKGIVMNHDSKTVSIDGENVAFTRTEFELLWILLNHRDHVFSRQELIEAVWPSDVVVIDRTVDVNIARMRKKLGEYACHIASRQGYGYFFEG